MDLLHRIRVFVFELSRFEPRYLLLRSNQGLESSWGPIQGRIGFGEKMETAVRREVMDDAGILRPLETIDLEMPATTVLGDEQVIEWTYGLKIATPERELRLDPRWTEFRWSQFSEGYPLLELESDRAAILRLHTFLAA